jgi:superfamily I DNA/RNA helicase
LALSILGTNTYALRALRQTFSHVFLDEFQDATTDQYALLRAAFLGTETLITAVGDVKQRIMTWAGALEGVLGVFAEDFNAKPLPLYQNFRSAPRLRRMQNRMIEQMDPEAASPPADLVGEDGAIEVLPFSTQTEEAQGVASLVTGWLDARVPPTEIAILVRQQSGPITAELCAQLQRDDVAYRNEQDIQDLSAEPVVALIFNFLRVVVDDRQPDAYNELMRLAGRASVLEESTVRFDRSVKRLLQDCRSQVRQPGFERGRLASWEPLIERLLTLVSRPSLTALSAGYQQGSRLDDLIVDAQTAFENELAIDGDPAAALKRLSDSDAVRILTIHKCKGLEFEKVVVLGVERELFWGSEAASEFFVAISRAKRELVLTYVNRRARPNGITTRRWDVDRRPQSEFIGYASDP